ncbi:MAG: DUF4364 family protein [Clostridia bacterium]|nr:DUF4364 family protein [Clostridia bacterium]
MAEVQREAHRDKLTLLYALLHLGPCTEDQLVRFNDAYSMMEQFQLYVTLGELRDAQMIVEEQRLERKLLSVTEEGKNMLSMFGEDVWPSSKIQVDNNAAEWKHMIRDELQMPAEWQRQGNEYRVTLRLLENDNEIFNLSMMAVDRQQAVDFCRRWPKQASFLYRTIMEKLGEEQENQ